MLRGLRTLMGELRRSADGDTPRQSWRPPSRWSRLVRRIGASLRGTGNWIVAHWSTTNVLLLIFVVVVTVLAFQRSQTVEPIQVSAALKDRLPAGDVLSRRIVDEVAIYALAVQQLKASADRSMPSAHFDLPQIDIPGTTFSLGQAVLLIRHLFHLHEKRIGGELSVVESPADGPAAGNCTDATGHQLRLRLHSDELGELGAAAVTLCGKLDNVETFLTGRLDQLVAEVSLRVYEGLSPCGAATYYFYNWRNPRPGGGLLDPDLMNAERAIGKCLILHDGNEAAYAFYVQGRIRQSAGRPQDAVRSFQSAIERYNASLWHAAGDRLNRGLVALGLTPFRSYLPSVYVNWGNSLLDQRTADRGKREDLIRGAIEQYQLALDRDSGNAPAYSGLGNALGELGRLLGAERRSYYAAACVYIAGGKKQRFDAGLRHNFATLYERFADDLRFNAASTIADRWAQVETNEEVARRCKGKDPMNRGASDADEGSRKDRTKPVDGYQAALREALRNHRKAVELDPENEGYLVALGRVELKIAGTLVRGGGNMDVDARWARWVDDAERAFRRALEVRQGDSFDARQGLADVLGARQRWNAIKREWRKAAEFYARQADKDPGEPRYRYSEGRAYFSMTDFRQAENVYRRLISEHRDFMPGYVALARTLVNLGYWDDALQCFAEARKGDPGSLEAADWLQITLLGMHSQPGTCVP